MSYRGRSKGSYGNRSRGLRTRAFKAGRSAALKENWKPFTKMTKKQHDAFNEAYHKVY